MNFLYLISVAIALISNAESKVTVTRFEHCDKNADYSIKVDVTLKNDTEGQIVEEGSAVSSVDVGDNIVHQIDLLAFEDGEYGLLISVSDTTCNIMTKYLGEFADELQKAAGLQPGTCPIPKGSYKVENYFLDFEKFKYRNFPEGKLRIKVHMKEAASKKLVSCLEADFTIEKK